MKWVLCDLVISFIYSFSFIYSIRLNEWWKKLMHWQKVMITICSIHFDANVMVSHIHLIYNQYAFSMDGGVGIAKKKIDELTTILYKNICVIKVSLNMVLWMWKINFDQCIEYLVFFFIFRFVHWNFVAFELVLLFVYISFQIVYLYGFSKCIFKVVKYGFKLISFTAIISLEHTSYGEKIDFLILQVNLIRENFLLSISVESVYLSYVYCITNWEKFHCKTKYEMHLWMS